MVGLFWLEKNKDDEFGVALSLGYFLIADKYWPGSPENHPGWKHRPGRLWG